MTQRERKAARPFGLARELLAWYDVHRRRLPWREAPSPYKTLVSEFMLQQTTVATVLPYFERFLCRFPTLAALARAPESAVLAAWSGLGYYTRARNLHRAAIVSLRDHDGDLPHEESALRRLPGVGPYTAAAIAAIAFDEHAFAVDGNSARVIARIAAIRNDIRSPAVRQRIKTRGEVEVPTARAGDFMQAVMELGALVCTPKNPSCTQCPIRPSCGAYRAGLTASIPRVAPKPARRVVHVACVALQDPATSKPRFAVVRRDDNELLGGTWSLPEAVITPGQSREAIAHRAAALVGLTADKLEPIGVVRQIFTHRDVTAFVFRGNLKANRRASSNKLRWVFPDQLSQIAISSFAKKTLRLVAETPSTTHDRRTNKLRTNKQRLTPRARIVDSTTAPRST